jgi:hypothetical protein
LRFSASARMALNWANTIFAAGFSICAIAFSIFFFKCYFLYFLLYCLSNFIKQNQRKSHLKVKVKLLGNQVGF